MENYQRRKLYQIHLKNISEIKNCRQHPLTSEFPSRLFNFSHGSSFRIHKKGTLQSSSTDHQKNYRMSSRRKAFQDKQQLNFVMQQENIRLGIRLLHTPSCINMRKNLQDYKENQKIVKMHRKVKENRKTRMYCITDISFKGFNRNLEQEYTIYEMNNKNAQKLLLKGSIFQLRNCLICGYRDEPIRLKIQGRGVGFVKLDGQQKMVAIKLKRQIVGNLIVEIS